MNSRDAEIAAMAVDYLKIQGEERKRVIESLAPGKLNGDMTVVSVLRDYGVTSGSGFFPFFWENDEGKNHLEWLTEYSRHSACLDFYQDILPRHYSVQVLSLIHNGRRRRHLTCRTRWST
jgi:hypothetical protein